MTGISKDDASRVQALVCETILEAKRILMLITDTLSGDSGPEIKPATAGGTLAAILYIAKLITEDMGEDEKNRALLMARTLESVMNQGLTEDQIRKAVTDATGLALMATFMGNQEAS